jgi:predicted phage-related endonuclease
VLSPLERQSEVIEQLVRRQLQMEQDLVHGLVGPAQAMTQALGKAPEAIRAQATAFRAAAVSFSQAADLLEVQAEAIEQTIGALQAPVHLARRGLGRASEPDA